jgi:hypothetical protein
VNAEEKFLIDVGLIALFIIWERRRRDVPSNYCGETC